MSRSRNTFADRAGDYASARPHYPAALFRWIADRCPARQRAWDCASGNGQAAIGLSEYFETVEATDISPEQLAHALPRANVAYSVRSAEDSGFPAEHFDVVTVAQALHWLDFSRFWPEVSRVGRRGGLFCAWGYDWLETVPEVERELVEPFAAIVAPFWAANNRILWDGYEVEDTAFPYERMHAPTFTLELEWTLEELRAYMMTWSAFQHSRRDARASASMDTLLDGTRALVAPDRKLAIRMPLIVLASRIDSHG